VPVAAPSSVIVTGEEPKTSRAPLAIAAAIVLVAIGAGAWYFLSSKPAPKPAPAPKQVVAAAKPAPPPVVSTPVVSTPSETATVDPAAQKKAFEDAVNAKLQAQLLQLQADYTKKLQQTQSKNAPVTTQAQAVPTSAPQQEERVSAAALDERRLQAERTQPAPQTATTATAPPQTTTQVAQRPQTQTAPPPAAPASTVREGDVIDISQLDTVPHPLTPIRPQYPPIARRQRIEGAIFLTALISETGEVVEVRILGGEQRMGLGDAAVRALREARFSPGVKDGKRVKTWFPQTIVFKL
jgi:protein TonB